MLGIERDRLVEIGLGAIKGALTQVGGAAFVEVCRLFGFEPDRLLIPFAGTPIATNAAIVARSRTIIEREAATSELKTLRDGR